ncbi:hypothetical protein IMSHALPRED_008453 [Imshaugia aleurites]|uniref:Uncharacterized protein n=1 Tax=Imshaugia aleurites TaxID=172621 RepID=A0A8H3I040_9LECA|nr:hypothetical protein IMSHALPRED_008453 [Imshaugia aleurites]
MAASTNGDQASVIDMSAHPTAQKLNARCAEFFAEVEDLTPGKDLEQRLNTDYGPGTPYYEDFCAYILQGLKEGWVAETQLDGDRYRRGKIALPGPQSRFFSITTVYMDSQDVYSGQHHAHPYGEINCVVQIDKTAELKGMQGWQGAGVSHVFRSPSFLIRIAFRVARLVSGVKYFQDMVHAADYSPKRSADSQIYIVDESRPGNPSLSSGEGRGACGFVLFAGWEDFL